METGKRILLIMKAKGITKSKLAEAIDINRNTLKKYIDSNLDLAPMSMCLKIARELGVSPGFILGKPSESEIDLWNLLDASIQK